MTTFERIKELAQKRDKNLKEISLELGYSKNYLYTLRTKEPTADKLDNIANYFNVSVDYLLGREHNNSMERDLDKMLDEAVSYSGKPMSQHDKEVIRAFLIGKFSD